MSRSALWRQEEGAKERKRHASGVLEHAIIMGRVSIGYFQFRRSFMNSPPYLFVSNVCTYS